MCAFRFQYLNLFWNRFPRESPTCACLWCLVLFRLMLFILPIVESFLKFVYTVIVKFKVHWFTLCNIGSRLPRAVTTFTLSCWVVFPASHPDDPEFTSSVAAGFSPIHADIESTQIHHTWTIDSERKETELLASSHEQGRELTCLPLFWSEEWNWPTCLCSGARKTDLFACIHTRSQALCCCVYVISSKRDF